MNQIQEYINFLDNLSINIESIIENAIIKNEGKILKIVKNRLFNKGRDGTGSLIKPDYAPLTLVLKKKKGQRKSHVTLRDSGDLYRSFVIEYKNSNIFIETNKSYKDDLIEQYSEDIFELTIQEVRLILDVFIDNEIQSELNKLK